MITVSSDTKLTIILPNTNKAFAEAVKNATPEQLDQLKEGKDIKSLLTSVFQDKITASKSDQTLLELLKNTPAFKNMGNFADDLKSLFAEVKNSPELPLKGESIERFLKTITSLDTATLKSQMASSGVFMESKIGFATQIMPTLKETLQLLQNLLSKSNLPDAKALNDTIGSLLETPELNQLSVDLKSAEFISGRLKNITDTLRGILSGSDVLYSKEMVQFAQKIDQLINTAPLAHQEIKATLSELYSTLLSSKAADSNTLLDSIELLLKNISKPGIDPLPQIKEFSAQLRIAIGSGDIAVSDEVSKLIIKLSEFTRPKELIIDALLKDSMSNDLKSGLMKLAEEFQSSPHPKAGELLEQANKLLTQIDYHQLISYLGNSNSIYIPFVWDQLEEGSLAFKKTKEKKFYCEINLRLKEYGKLDLMMVLYDKNQIEIQAHTEKPELKELMQEHIGQLRSVLINAGLTPRGIRIFEKKESQNSIAISYGRHSYESDMGFEVKV